MRLARHLQRRGFRVLRELCHATMPSLRLYMAAAVSGEGPRLRPSVQPCTR